MKTLREMMDLIVETEQAKYPVKLDDMFGGGTLDRSETNEMITATYTNKRGELEVKLTITPKENRMFIKRNGGNIRGEEMTKFPIEELHSMFLDMVNNDMIHNCEQMNAEVNKNKDTLPYLKDLVNKINGKNMNESQKINEDVRAAAMAQIKPFFDDLLVAMKRMKGEVNGTLGENTSVNMSPYKDSIKNAETPKQKSAI